MEKKLKAKWLKALRSGAIKQGRGALIDESGSMCCIGVLGRVCGVDNKWLLENAGAVRGTGFDWLEPQIAEQVVDKLVDMNDGNERTNTRKRSFKQIANWIEINL